MVSLPQQIEPVSRKLASPSAPVTKAAGLADEQRARGDIPGIETALPEGVERPGGDIGEIKRGAAHASHVDDASHHSRQLRLEPRMLSRLAEMGNAAAEKSLRQVGARRDSQAAIVAERPLSLFGHVHIIVCRIVDDAGDDLPFALQRDRDREHRDRVQEIGRRVERIDVPGVALVGSFDPPALLHDKAVARPRLREFLIERLFRALVGEADKIAGAFHRHLQFADLAEIALEAAAGLDRGAGHHGHQGRADHGVVPWRRKRAEVYGRRSRRGNLARWPREK